MLCCIRWLKVLTLLRIQMEGDQRVMVQTFSRIHIDDGAIIIKETNGT